MKEIILKPILLLAVVTIFFTYSSAQVAIGTLGTTPTPDPNAVLFLTGNGSQGLIIPVVTSLGSFGKAGMVVYNSTSKFIHYHDGTAWNQIGGGSSAATGLRLQGNVLSLDPTGTASIGLSGSAPTAVDKGKLFVWDGAQWTTTPTPTTTNQILKWDNTTGAWVLGTDNTGTATTGNLTTTTTGVTITNGTNSVIGTGTSVNIQNATGSQSGLLSSTDFTTFNNKVSGVTANAPLAITGSAASPVINFSGWPANVAGVLTNNGSGSLSWSPAVGVGTVTSVGLAMPSIFTVSNSPVITSGTLTAALNSQAANTVFAAPTGSAGAPTFRTLTALDIPSLSAAQITSGTLAVGVGGTGATSLTGLLVGNGASPFTAITTGSNGQVLTVNLGAPSWQPAPPPTGAAGGDLTGSYPNPTISSTAGTNVITAINGAASLINGARINTSFGAQNISTTGTLAAGATTVTGLTIGTSVWPANAGGVLTNNGTGTLTWGSSLTNPMTTPGDIIYGGAAGVATRLATGTGFLKGGATPSYTTINLASVDVAGILPIVNGGTGATTAPVALTNLGAMSNTLTNGNIFVGNGSNVATGVAMSGDATINNTGLLTVSTGGITSAKILDGTIADADVSGSAAIAGNKINPAFGASNISTTGTLSIGGSTTFNTKTYTWPSAALVANTFLQTDATGNLSWTAAATPFTNLNVLPKGSPSGLVASQIIDDGAHVSINGAIDPLYKFQVYGVNPAIAVDNSGIKIGDVTGGSYGNYFYTDFESTPGKFYFMGGNVGIGTSTPTSILDVVGTANTTGLNVTNTSADIATFKSTSASDNRILFANSGGTFGTLGYTPFNNTFALTTYTNLDLSIGSNNLATEIMRLKAGGNVGIGTTSVINKLDVEGGVAIGASYSGTNVAPSNGLLVEGSVGIGLTSVTGGTKLEITGGDLRISDSFPFITLNASTSTNNSGFNFIEAGTSKAYIYYKGSSDEIWLSNSSGGGSQHLSIGTTGDVGLGRTAVTNQLELSGNASKAIAGSWLANSDRRIKTDILDIDNSLDLVKKLRPVKFKYTDEWMKRNPIIKNQYYYNFIAQEYQNVFPNAVKGSGEYLEGDSIEILQIDTYDAQIVTIKAVQELIMKIEALEKENSQLKGTNTQLKSEVASLKEKQGSDIEAMKKQVEEIKKLLSMEASTKKK